MVDFFWNVDSLRGQVFNNGKVLGQCLHVDSFCENKFEVKEWYLKDY